MNKKDFSYFFTLCSFAALIISIFLTNQNYYNYLCIQNNTKQTLGLPSINNFINETQKVAIDVKILQLINWGGQGTITWGVVFIAALTVFFTIWPYLRPENKKAEQKPVIPNEKIILWMRNNPEDLFLSCSAFLFFIAGIISIFQISYYYRYVAYLQSILNTIHSPPSTWLSNLFMDFYIEKILIAIFIIFSLISVLKLLWMKEIFD